MLKHFITFLRFACQFFGFCLSNISDERTLYYLIDKFERMRLKEYYKTSFPQIKVPYSDDEIEQLQNSCGLSYTEKIIKNYINGGKKL